MPRTFRHFVETVALYRFEPSQDAYAFTEAFERYVLDTLAASAQGDSIANFGGVRPDR